MITRLIALALTATLASAFTLGAQDPLPETCREVYVEAWFLETAEGDLDGALATYKRCVELGGPGDRELVARAWWRMGMIARARDEATVAEEWLRIVVEEFGGAEVAARAAEALEAPVAPGPEAEAVARAREDLRELLLIDNTEHVSSMRLNAVFEVLSAQQIAADSARLGVPLRVMLDWYGSRLAINHAAKLVDLAFLTDLPSARFALRSIPIHGEEPLPERVYELAREESRELDPELARLLVSRADERSMETLRALVARSPGLLVWTQADDGSGATASHSEFAALLQNEHPMAGEVFGRFLDSVPRTRADLDGLVDFLVRTNEIMILRTPAADRMRAVFPELTAAGREKLAITLRSLDSASLDGVPRVAVDLVLADPEPEVREQGLMWLVAQGDRASISEALERAASEPLDMRAKLIEAAAQETAPAYPAADLIEAADAGPLREYAYRSLIWATSETFAEQGRSVLDVLRIGIERQDVELLEALFENSPTFQFRNPNESSVRGVAMRELAGSPEREGADGLASRLFSMMLDDTNERIRRVAIPTAVDVVGEAELAELRRRALRDPSPRVRADALGVGHLRGIPAETVHALLLDPDDNVFRSARNSAPTPEALLAALPNLSSTRRGVILQNFQQPGYESVVRALFDDEREGDPGWLVEVAFQHLETRDAEVLVTGFLHDNSNVRRRALAQLGQLDLPIPLRPQMTGVFDEEPWRAHQALLLERIDEVADALLRWNLNQLEGRLDNATARKELANGLARLDARDELLERALHVSSRHRDVGGRGLVILGDRERMLQALRSCSYPGGLVPYALQLDLADECFALWEAGRLDLYPYVEGILAAGLDAELPRVLLGTKDQGQVNFANPWLDRGVAAAAAREDTTALSRAATRFGSRAAVRALAELEAWELLVEDLPNYAEDPRTEALVELARKTGAPVEWSEYRTEQRAVQDALRTRLGLPPR